MFHKRLAKYWPLVFILIFTVIFFHRLFFPLSIFSTPGDIAYFNYPLKDFLSLSLKNHQLPLWNSNIGTGIPVLADSPIGTFYFPNLILFYLFSAPFAFNASYILIFLTSAIGMYLLCKTYKLSSFSSLFASLAFAYSGFFIARIIHISFIQVVSLLPLSFLTIEYFIRTTEKKYLLLLSLILSQMIFAGYMQGVTYSLISLLLYFILRISFIIRLKRSIIKYSLFFLLSVTFGSLLAAIQIIPSLELLQNSTRVFGLSEQKLFINSGTPKILLMFFNPFYFGNISKGTLEYTRELGFYWENVAYSGFLTPFLSFVSLIFIKKNRIVLTFIILAIISILLALGINSPLHIFYDFPPLSFFRIPARFLFITSFSIAILAAFGLNHIERIRFNKLNILSLMAILIISFDIFIHWYDFNPYTKMVDFLKQPISVQKLKESKSSGRVSNLWPYLKTPPFGPSWKKQNEQYILHFNNLSPNINSIFNIPSPEFYTSLVTRRLNIYRNIYTAQVKEINENKAEIKPVALNLLKLQDTEFIISHLQINNDELEPIYQFNFGATSQNYTIYKIMDTFPRVRMVKNVIMVNTVTDLTNKLQDPDINFQTTAILEKPITPLKKTFDQYQITNFSDIHNEVAFDVETDGDGYLLLADSYYPGWEAKVNNNPVEIYPANGNSRIIYINKGKNNIQFKYKPKSLKIGASITFSSIALLFIILINIKLKIVQRILKKSTL